MKITVWVVSTCIPERGEKPCQPDVFGTEAEAEAYADQMLRNEWDSNAMEDDAGAPLPYPGDWRTANEQIAASYSDGSWGEWQITSHQVEVGPKPLEWEGDEDSGDDEAGEYEASCIFGAYRLVGNGSTFNLLLTYVSGQQLYQTLVAEGISLDEGKEIAAINHAGRLAGEFA